MTPKKPDWFEMTESGDSYAGIKKVNKKLPIATLVVAGAVILGGSLFANANNESPAIAETPTASQSAVASTSNSVASTSVASNSVASTSSSSPTHATTSSNNSAGGNSLPAPIVSSAPQRGEGGHEGREGGEHREGDRHEGDRSEHEDD